MASVRVLLTFDDGPHAAALGGENRTGGFGATSVAGTKLTDGGASKPELDDDVVRNIGA